MLGAKAIGSRLVADILWTFSRREYMGQTPLENQTGWFSTKIHLPVTFLDTCHGWSTDVQPKMLCPGIGP